MTYLDTHTVLWLFAGDVARLPPRVLRAVEADDLLVSPIVHLELQYLLEAGRTVVKPVEILARLREELGLSVCDRDFAAVVLHAASMNWTRDPFDRIITAQAGVTNSPLLTKDRTIRSHYRHAVWD